MTNKEAIDIIKNAIAEVEWEYPMDYAAAFEMAVEALAKDDSVPGNGWIRVRDRLPNDYQPVIVSDDGEPEFAIFYDHYNGYGPTFVTPDCYEEERIEGITHWMPLPEPPKEEET
jgi:hypothetical protein